MGLDSRFKPFNIIDKDDNMILLERRTFNGRTLLCWYNESTEQANITLFNLSEQPNDLSQHVVESQWGWMTHFVQNIETIPETSEVVSLYLQDMEKENFWWEVDTLH